MYKLTTVNNLEQRFKTRFPIITITTITTNEFTPNLKDINKKDLFKIIKLKVLHQIPFCIPKHSEDILSM